MSTDTLTELPDLEAVADEPDLYRVVMTRRPWGRRRIKVLIYYMSHLPSGPQLICKWVNCEHVNCTRTIAKEVIDEEQRRNSGGAPAQIIWVGPDTTPDTP